MTACLAYLQGRSSATRRCEETLSIYKSSFQLQRSIKDCYSPNKFRFQSSLWADFQFTNIQLAREFETTGRLWFIIVIFKEVIWNNYSCNACILFYGSIVKTEKPLKDPLWIINLIPLPCFSSHKLSALMLHFWCLCFIYIHMFI